MNKLRFFLAAAGVLVGVGTVPAVAGSVVTIDFTQAGQGPFNQNFFASSGIVFTQGTFVGFVQGDDALVGPPIAGSFLTPVTSLAVNVALGFQAVDDFSLTVYDASSAPISTTTFILDQDTGNPNFMGWGYFTISLPNIPQPAYSFTLSDQFVSGPINGSTEFGDSSLVFTQVPEPGPLFLLATGLIGMLGAHRMSNRQAPN